MADEDVYFCTVQYLRGLGYDVETVSEKELSGKDDHHLIEYAHQHDAVFLTRDKDFGRLVFLQLMPTSGILLLRIQPQTIESVHDQIEVLFDEIAFETLQSSFITIGPSERRIRELPQT